MSDKCGCPMAVQGTQVSYEDSADGAAMLFTTQAGDVLQARVAAMAERHNSKGPRQSEHHIAHTARVENVDHGARLVMVPNDPSQLDALRAHVRAHVQKIQAGECPMMRHGAEGHERCDTCEHCEGCEHGHEHGGHGHSH